MELAIASSVSGLIQLAEIVLKHGYGFIKHAKSADRVISSLLREITRLKGTLKVAADLLALFEGAQMDFKASTQADLDSCEETLRTIHISLPESYPTEAGNLFEAARRRLTWPFKVSETKDLTDKIERHKSALSIALNSDNWSVNQPDSDTCYFELPSLARIHHVPSIAPCRTLSQNCQQLQDLHYQRISKTRGELSEDP